VACPRLSIDWGYGPHLKVTLIRIGYIAPGWESTLSGMLTGLSYGSKSTTRIRVGLSSDWV
jgi:hypothetical protein